MLSCGQNTSSPDTSSVNPLSSVASSFFPPRKASLVRKQTKDNKKSEQMYQQKGKSSLHQQAQVIFSLPVDVKEVHKHNQLLQKQPPLQETLKKDKNNVRLLKINTRLIVPKYTSASLDPIRPLKFLLVADMPTSPGCNRPAPKLFLKTFSEGKTIGTPTGWTLPNARAAARWEGFCACVKQSLPVPFLLALIFHFTRCSSHIKVNTLCHFLPLLTRMVSIISNTSATKPS